MAGSIHVGRFVWRDLVTTNVEMAQCFYAQLFGWTDKKEDLAGPQPYTMIWAPGGQGIGGVTLDTGAMFAHFRGESGC